MGRGMDALLRGLWGWKGLAQREGQARQGCLKRVCQRALQGRKADQAHTDPRPTKSECDSADAKQTERLLKAKCGGAEREDSAENLIDGAVGKQSLSLATDKV